MSGVRRPGEAAHAHWLSPDKELFDNVASLLSEQGELVDCSAQQFSPAGSMQGPLLLFLMIIVIFVIMITVVCYYRHLPRHTCHFFCLLKCQYLVC